MREMCEADKPVVTLKLVVDGLSTSYTDDFYKCNKDSKHRRDTRGPANGWCVLRLMSEKR
jgi:hypothetical protein